MKEFTLEKFEEASELVQKVTSETKLVFSEFFSEQSGNKVFFKPENMQYTGAYKVRGAYYKIFTLSEEEKKKGIVTASAGNHAQGVAYAAKLSGINVEVVNFIFVFLTAITVSIASRTVGALIVSSLMVVPVATSIMIAKSYKSMMIISVVFAFVEVISGITISYYAGLKPGATIVLLAVILFIITSFFRRTK